MTVTTRTNLATNPNAASLTNYTYWAGTGGACTLTNLTTGGNTGSNFNRITFTTGTTTVSGGGIYDEPSAALVAGTPITVSYWVRPSIAQWLTPQAQLYNGGTATGVVTGANTSCPANVWTQLTATITPVSGDNHIQFRAYALSGGAVVWPTGSTLDIDTVMIGDNGTYFDGSFVNAASTVYAWTGTANASTSTATTYQPVITVVAKTDAPCPRVEVTIQDLDPGNDVVNVWRTADGKRQAVRSARRWNVVGSDFVIDYEAPLGRPLAYDLEVVSGVCALAPVTTANVTVTSASWWIQDPLVPSSAIAVSSDTAPDGSPTLSASAVKALEYAASVTIIPILGSDQPVALSGNRTIAGNVDFSLFTDAAEQSALLRDLIQQTPLLLVRPNGDRFSDPLPGLCYLSSAKPVEQPNPTTYSGTLTHWQLSGDLVAAPTMNVLVPIWTYGTVEALWATYQQAQTTLASKAYLDVQKSPSGV